jgi:hypothetical protein
LSSRFLVQRWFELYANNYAVKRGGKEVTMPPSRNDRSLMPLKTFMTSKNGVKKFRLGAVK